jgi:hypothetical protein
VNETDQTAVRGMEWWGLKGRAVVIHERNCTWKGGGELMCCLSVTSVV